MRQLWHTQGRLDICRVVRVLSCKDARDKSGSIAFLCSISEVFRHRKNMVGIQNIMRSKSNGRQLIAGEARRIGTRLELEL